ncbi:AlkA N-terminal domain-containing protein [Nocardioides limicola]|uniref:AlkA N-terminal domain-containing protein n=1 Tax=Nocardioides limicola TaxID=2803368 RepID=UPI00193AF852|nr:AlkA N-terminal domain-containing protein [Nocardioides sp. DJM-14]
MTTPLDPLACHAAVRSRDRRFDGVFYTGVRTTGIYCRPSCPARTPSLANVTFLPTAAAAQRAGFRACKRCLPDATPGSPEWDLHADVAGRAMRMIADGVVDRDGVPGLARRLGYTPRHTSRILQRELGAGPLALARARRAESARALIEAGDLPLADVAFAAGFSSIRQFNATFREVYATNPGDLRRTAASGSGRLHLRIPVRTPYDGGALLAFLATRAVPGVEYVEGSRYARTLRLPHGTGTVVVDLADPAGQVPASFRLDDLRDVGAAVERVRRLLDADADPLAVLERLSEDPALAPHLRPGLRVPGHVDGDELAARAVLGQQVTVAAARRLAAELVLAVDDRLPEPDGQLTHLFPSAAAIAGHRSERMPRARAAALSGLCAALADGTVALDRSRDRARTRADLLALPGIGPWTADYIAMRALGDPDVLLTGDAGTRRALAGLTDPHPDRWRPWRSYAQLTLWQLLTEEAPDVDPD